MQLVFLYHTDNLITDSSIPWKIKAVLFKKKFSEVNNFFYLYLNDPLKDDHEDLGCLSSGIKPFCLYCLLDIILIYSLS